MALFMETLSTSETSAYFNETSVVSQKTAIFIFATVGTTNHRPKSFIW
jgi:hypothetical protein